jgi:hypothetical protein
VNIDTGGVNVFHECYVDPAMPTILTDVVRSCSGKATIVDCPNDFADRCKHFFGDTSFGQKVIWPKSHLAKKSFGQKVIWPNAFTESQLLTSLHLI